MLILTHYLPLALRTYASLSSRVPHESRVPYDDIVDALTLTPFERPFRATVTPPGSKSLTNRALIIAALANGRSEIANVLLADDTRVMIDGLGELGFRLELDEKKARVRVHGQSGDIPASNSDIFCANSGTTIRFLTALTTLGHGAYRLDGNERMRERPIGELRDLLATLGADVRYEKRGGYPPVAVTADGLPGGIARFPAAHSSQYLSAALMVAPYAQIEPVVNLDPGQTSWPYVEMTIALMHRFGCRTAVALDPATREPTGLRVISGVYQAGKYDVEPDASSATYFLAAAAIRPGARVTILGLGRRSLQGDVGFAGILEGMGAAVTMDDDEMTFDGPAKLRGVDADMSGMPDAAMTLAATAVFAEGPTTIRGLHTLRVKETDRLAALQAELEKLGATVDIEDTTLRIQPPADLQPAEIETYDDHRMAMSFAVIGTRAPGITIRDPNCVSKTYPAFWQDLERLRRSQPS
jgi:3-phosphoshikimate 1-carboxyvinyltransferase